MGKACRGAAARTRLENPQGPSGQGGLSQRSGALLVQDPESRSGKLSCTCHSWGLDLLSWLSKVGKNRILAGPAGTCLDTNTWLGASPFLRFPLLGLSFPTCSFGSLRTFQQWIWNPTPCSSSLAPLQAQDSVSEGSSPSRTPGRTRPTVAMAATLPGNKGWNLTTIGCYGNWACSPGAWSLAGPAEYSAGGPHREIPALVVVGYQQKSPGLVVPDEDEAADCWRGLRLDSPFHTPRPSAWNPIGLPLSSAELHISCDSGHFTFLTATVVGLLSYRL